MQKSVKLLKNPTYYQTIVSSDIWKKWTKHCEKTMDWDIHESIECGWLSPEHWSAFIKSLEVEHCSEPKCPECNKVAYNKGYEDGKDYWKREYKKDLKIYIPKRYKEVANHERLVVGNIKVDKKYNGTRRT